MRVQAVFGLVALAAALACDDASPVCRFGSEHGLFRSDGQAFHDVAAVRFQGRALALFSDTRGVHALPLDARGAPVGPARRLFEGCDAGLDAKSRGSELQIACLRRASAATETGGVTLYELDARLAVRANRSFGGAGRLSHGIVLSTRDGSPAVAWHDAAVSGGRIWYFEPERMSAPRIASDESWEASAPSLAAVDRALYLAWAETRYAGELAASRILVTRPSDRGQPAPRVLLESRDAAPSPRLVALRGGFLLSFRDRRESLRKTGLYLARVSSEGRLVGSVVRAGRADGRASPELEACLGGVVSATPRTFAGDYFVGVLRADAELRRLSPEQQFYEDSREFDRVAALCERDSALLLIAERGRLLKGNAELRSTTFHCD